MTRGRGRLEKGDASISKYLSVIHRHSPSEKVKTTGIFEIIWHRQFVSQKKILKTIELGD